METVAGIFRSRADAEKAVQRFIRWEIKNDRIALLTPEMDEEQMEESVPVAGQRATGMGKAMEEQLARDGGGGGASLGAAAASLLSPWCGSSNRGRLFGGGHTGRRWNCHWHGCG